MKSPIFQASFTDIYGVAHPQAQCMISMVSRTDSAYFDAAGEGAPNTQINYQVRYWHTSEAKDGGAESQEYITRDRQNTFSINNNEQVETSALIETCQQHFLTSVLTQAKAAA